MTVYIVFEHWEYEGTEVKGVFATKTAAEAEADRLTDPEAHYRVSYYVVAYHVQQ
jgi:hypothetical protein